jgi:DNA-directed RNA polymerase specialized sigma24 family protein
VGDSAADWEPPSGAALAVALGRGSEAGLLAAYDAYGPDLFGYAQFLLASRPDPEADRADQAAGAVLDALLAATGAVGDLTDPDRMLPWLLALTRNECLRRGAGAGHEDEAAELGRRGLGPLEAAALLGFAPAALPRRVPPGHTPPAWLRAELLAAAGPEAVALRAELTRRARPLEPDGFPIPLDRRRLSGKVLAWSAAAVVVIALGLLVGLPAKSDAGSSATAPAALAGPGVPSATAPPAGAPDDPVPTLGPALFGSAGGAPASVTSPPAVADEADARAGSPAPSAATSTAATPQAGTDAAGRGSRTSGSIEVSWTPATDSCGDTWSAHLHATTGGVQVSRLTAVAARTGATVALHPDGDGWSGDLTGLPTDRSVTVSVVADGAVRPGWARLRADC